MTHEKLTIEYRPLVTIEEIEASIALQEIVWGFEPVDVVPVPLIVIAQKYGGFVYGAFEKNRLIGFCFSLPALGPHIQLQWSHMTAIHPDYQGKGIGYQLKCFQKAYARQMKFPLIAWTFDPLESRNAYFNLEKLGVIVRLYEPNIYGVTTSKLHHGLPTDRFVAEWWVDFDKHAFQREIPDHLPFGIVLKHVRGRPYPLRTNIPEDRTFWVPIPDISIYPRSRQARRSYRARWQRALRECFIRAFSAGYVAVRFKPWITPTTHAYLLVHTQSLQAQLPHW